MPSPPKLPPRLRAVADAVPAGSVAADVGTDHALLPAYLVASGRCPRAIAIEARPGPLAAARRTLQALGLEGRVDLRQGDGLAPLAPGEADVVILAGLGGETIAAIVAASPEVAATVRRWVLQPMRGEGALRAFLDRAGLRRIEEVRVTDRGRAYVVMVAEPEGPAGEGMRGWS